MNCCKLISKEIAKAINQMAVNLKPATEHETIALALALVCEYIDGSAVSNASLSLSSNNLAQRL